MSDGMARSRLHEKALFEADTAGRIGVWLTLDPSYGPGSYAVVVALTDDYQPDENAPSLDGAIRTFNIQ